MRNGGDQEVGESGRRRGKLFQDGPAPGLDRRRRPDEIASLGAEFELEACVLDGVWERVRVHPVFTLSYSLSILVGSSEWLVSVLAVARKEHE